MKPNTDRAQERGIKVTDTGNGWWQVTAEGLELLVQPTETPAGLRARLEAVAGVFEE